MENQPKKLYRSQTDKIIAGVCGGIGKYFEIDPILIRGAFILLGLINGAGLILYIILAIIMPKEPSGETQEVKAEDSDKTDKEKFKEAAKEFKKDAHEFAQKMKDKSWFRDKRNVIGFIVIIVGLLALANQFVPHWFSWSLFWALALVFIGFYIIIKR
jgi:phage shock protein C